MNNILEHLQAQTENSQVHSYNCCHPILKNINTSSQQTLSLSSRKRSSTSGSEKGIKLTHNKSTNIIHSARTIKTTSEKKIIALGHPQRLNPKTINCTRPTQLVKQVENIHSNPTKKCIQYKNRRIVERISTQTCYQKTQCGDQSARRSKQYTEKYTPRTTIKTEQEYVEISEVIYQNSDFSTILSDKVQNNPETENGQRFFRPSKGKKTLSRLYEQQLGRRVVTIQSQDNESDDHLSIIQPFEWRIELN